MDVHESFVIGAYVQKTALKMEFDGYVKILSNFGGLSVCGTVSNLDFIQISLQNLSNMVDF